MKKIIFSIFSLAVAWVMIQGVVSSAGKSGKTGAPGENNCTQCHAGVINSNGGSVTISGVSEYQPGQTYNLSVTVTDASSSLFGFSAVALQASGDNGGSLVAGTDNHTEILNIAGFPRNYVTHNQNGGASTGTHTFNFTWTAPSTDIGDITFYVTANAANGNGGTSGDHIYSTTLTVGPQAVGGGSVVINEIDADQPAIDNAEFIELFGNPGMSLNGYALVLFNGNNDQSYAAYDLDGYSLDANGFFVLGTVPNANYVTSAGTGGFLQNGPDAVALVLGDDTQWPVGTVVSNAGLVDAVVYGTADAADLELLAALTPGQTQLDEGTANNTNSLSRFPDGGAPLTLSVFVAQMPTPGATNLDGGSALGCTDPTACNYSANALADDGSCAFPGFLCNDGNANTINDAYDASCICTGSVNVTEVSVTFQVDMTGITIGPGGVFLAGNFQGWNSTANPMSDVNGDNIYELTLSIGINQTIQYKFINGVSWESGNTECGVDDTFGGFNRTLDITSADVIVPVVCFNSCSACPGSVAGCTNPVACNFNPSSTLDDGSCILVGDACDDGNVGTTGDVLTSNCICAGTPLTTPFNITFQVDMTTQSGFTTPEVNGTFNNWCGNCAPMSDANGDGIWELTIPLLAGNYEFKFSADAWAMQENLIAGSSCTVTNGIFTNRTLVVSGDAVLPVVCWGACVDCSQATPYYDVTFAVDMNQQTGFTTPELNGTFNNWCGNCTPMSDANGDGIWNVTLTLLQGTYEYKFSTDNWTGQETLTPGDPCTITTDNFTNRLLNLTSDIVLDPVCYGSCSACFNPVNGCTNASACNFNPNANTDDGSCILVGDPCDDGNSISLNDIINANCECSGTIPNGGCTNSLACNFDPSALVDDGSCILVGDVCSDGNPSTINDVIGANCQCSGILMVMGCMDVNACNFNAAANMDDGSCLIVGTSCDDGNPNSSGDVIDANCQCSGVIMVMGCMDLGACNYNAAATMDDGSCLIVGALCDDGDPLTIEDMVNVNCECIGVGGTFNIVINEVDADQPAADNAEFIELFGTPNMSLSGLSLVLFNGNGDVSYQVYDLDGYSLNTSGFFVLGSVTGADYTVSSGTTGFLQNGADAVGLYIADSVDFVAGTLASNINLLDAVVYGTADPADAELISILVPGQTQLDEGMANNTNSLSRVPDGGAPLTLNLFVAQAPTPGATNVTVVSGCTNPLACNYDATAVSDDGSCLITGTPCDDGLIETINDVIDVNCGCSGTLVVVGCTDNSACNYDALAVVDDGSCLIIGAACDDGNIATINDIVDANCQCSGTVVAVGCTDIGACNYDPAAIVDDGTCILPGSSCDDGDVLTINDVIDVNCICSGTEVAGEVVINEVDADQPGADAAEFVELYGTPNMSLTGYTLVLFNGNGDTTYRAFDLDGYQLDANGFFVLGSVLEADYSVPSGTTGFLQNGADAVALYLADSVDFLIGTPASNLNLVDALVYGTADPDDAELINILVPGQSQMEEGLGNNPNSSSRIPDGGAALTQSLFVSQAPTPGVSNILPSNGCTDPLACNFDAAATADDGSCLFVGSSCDDGNAATMNDMVNAQCQCAGEMTTTSGCTDTSACNYDATATVDDGTCILPGDSCDDGNATTINDVISANCECLGIITQDPCLINPIIITLDSVAHNTCFGGAEGYISTSVTGGSNLYYANWNSNPIQTTPYAQNLPAGIYSLVITDTQGCSDTLTQEITQPDGSYPVISGVFDVDPMDNEQYTVNTWPGATYVWTVTGGSILSGDSTNTVTVVWNDAATGVISVTQTDSTGCVLSDNNVVYINAVGVEELSEEMVMYPNPAQSQISIQWGSGELRQYQIMDSMGRTVHQGESAVSQYVVDVTQWTSGLYLVKISSNGTEKTERLMVAH